MNFSVTFSNGTNSFNEGFYLTAFRNLENKNNLILALVIIYIITLLGNLVLLAVVLMNSSLQNPKYLAVCNLAIVDISMNSVIIPQMVPVLIFNQNYVSFGACFSQMFFVHFFGDMESFSLALLAYDRLIAICWHLRYSTINTNLRMLLIIVHCKIQYNKWITLTVLLGPLTFIFTYVIVVVAVTWIASTSQHWKAFHTCLTHLLLVLLYYTVHILAYILGNLRLIQNFDLYTAVLTVSVTISPMLNPIIYSLKTDELRDKIVKLLGKPKVAQQIIKNEAYG
uniref:Odorant receptor, family D, subfamily 107, member 1 n=1 Tax=Sinocyclocheilus anshuiensis TaxID=1608454 RepID=A0A671L061_9TELE